MLLESYFRENYCDVCNTQNSFDHDKKLVKSMLNGNVKHRDLKEWMRVYGLFQGIKSEDRDTIVNNFIDYNNNHIRILDVDLHTYFEVFGDIFDILYNAKKRMWISASTKLMWLMYPDETIIYDSFVFRSVVIIQSLDSELSKLPKIGNRPTINSIKNLHIIIEPLLSGP
ncbi:hypothetical protein KQI52_13850 [bacterium]|nr:hypothetical protein [bacterium]